MNRALPNVHLVWSTTEYEFSHGKRPQGFGSWAFEFRHGPAYTEGVLARLRIELQGAWTLGTSRVEIEAGVRPVVRVWVNQARLAQAKKALRKALLAALPKGGWLSISVAS